MTATLPLMLFAVPLAMAMAWDLTSFRIPNWLTGAMAAAFLPAALLAPDGVAPDGVAWAGHLAAGAVAFAVGAALFALRAMGGGDVKLLGAAALWLGLDQLAMFLLLTGALGGALTLAVLASRQTLPPLLAHLPGGGAVTLPRLLTPGEAVPYGVAIGAAALALAGHVPVVG
ncbi:A24 family peptidase [Azospirillum sp.]|uniref:A24 family peptidase n=1 Tax=Azospirillum sp. TaxID=34012 RepID=UPI002D70A29D|nr:prepilin peptidase [Azospirillum sp.]HYD66408.1 prepilin peptidase [Azospirillum sp.]